LIWQLTVDWGFDMMVLGKIPTEEEGLSTKQVTLQQLIEDPIYRQWLRTPPVGGFPKFVKFRVYAQREQGGLWAKRDFDDFKSAYNFLAKNFRKWHDAALVTRNYACRPPVVRINGKRRYHTPMLEMEGHEWCPYCRRPTVFGHFSRHHAFGHYKPLPFKRRCGVCGIAETAIKDYTKALK
jgi:hypothetical protein